MSKRKDKKLRKCKHCDKEKQNYYRDGYYWCHINCYKKSKEGENGI